MPPQQRAPQQQPPAEQQDPEYDTMMNQLNDFLDVTDMTAF